MFAGIFVMSALSAGTFDAITPETSPPFSRALRSSSTARDRSWTVEETAGCEDLICSASVRSRSPIAPICSTPAEGATEPTTMPATTCSSPPRSEQREANSALVDGLIWGMLLGAVGTLTVGVLLWEQAARDKSETAAAPWRDVGDSSCSGCTQTRHFSCLGTAR